VKPAWLSETASEKWNELAPHLEAMGVLTAADADLLAAYCECFARWRRVAQLAASSPPVFQRKGPVDEEGQREVVLTRNPLWSQVRDAEAALRVLAREYGLSPSARAGLRSPDAPADGGERLLTGGSG
jgi:P27 family predicted phage terminase small subunit